MPEISLDKQKQHQKIWGALIVLGILGLLVMIGVRLMQDDGVGTSVGEKPKDFVLQTYTGEMIATDNLRGKVVLVNFWASWCTTCPDDVVLLEETWQIISPQHDDVVFLGVAYMDTEHASKEFLSNLEVSYPNGPDLRGVISRAYQVSSVPETFILDRDGVSQYVRIGPFTGSQEILSALEIALNSQGN
jgi:cytochrome c biogenesis protein CcmG, thiol:disulfide interchange protein DsbE